MILHFQTTLPLLREANVVAQVLFYWFSVSVSSLSRVHLEARKTISWSFFLFFSVLLLGKEGGSKANKARQGRAGQGRQFVIMVGSAMAFWPGGNVIPEIIALAFSRAGSLPHVCVCVCLCPCSGLPSLPCSCGDGDGDQCCFRAATPSVSGRRPYYLAPLGPPFSSQKTTTPARPLGQPG